MSFSNNKNPPQVNFRNFFGCNTPDPVATRQEDAILSRTHPTPLSLCCDPVPSPQYFLQVYAHCRGTIMQVSVNRRRGQRRWSTMGCSEAKQRQSRVSSAIYDSRYTVHVSLDDLRWRGCKTGRHDSSTGGIGSLATQRSSSASCCCRPWH